MSIDQTTKSSLPRGSRRKTLLITSGVVLALLIAVATTVGPIMSRVEQPQYQTVASDNAFEIRRYGPIIIAEAEVSGDRKAAISEGFRLIAAYIFGKNAGSAKISMTAPVQQQQTIAMTAPVVQQNKVQQGRTIPTGNWTVHFIMPSAWTMETLPKPVDPRVVLKAVPERRLAVIRFSGFGGDAALAERTEQLRRYVLERGLKATGEPAYAFYDPPWTLPFLRRNEVMLELVE